MITRLTRRDLRELIGSTWRGRLTDAEFLSRLYDLEELPSKDDRFSTMTADIAQHRENNNDWEDAWIFSDDRLQLDNDEKLLRLVAETLHPEVVRDGFDVKRAAAQINALLLPDGHELFAAGTMSLRPVYGWRRTMPRKPPSGPFPRALVAGLSRIFANLRYNNGDYYTSLGIDSMFEEEDFPPREEEPGEDLRQDNLGIRMAEVVKSRLRAAQNDPNFDHWAGLARVLAQLFEPTEGADHAEQEGTDYAEDYAKQQQRIREVLAKCDITYLSGARFTTAPQIAIAGLPSTPHLPSDRWSLIGSGGFGTVYRATDPRLGIDFAVKVFDPFPGLSSHADARARFVREAGLLFRLRHENIVRVYDAGELTDGRPYIKMEYFDGLNLQKAREQRVPTVEESIAIVGQLAAAVEHAHSRSTIHRDIKPSNVLVSASHDELRLIDFGLGILVEEAVTRSRLTMSAQQFGGVFAAPELLENAKTTDPSVDIYSIGAIWYWLHAGQSPKGTGLDYMIDGFEIDVDLKKLLRSCLSPASKRPTIGSMLADLRAWVRKRKPLRDKLKQGETST